MATRVRIVRDAGEIQESVTGGGSFRRYQVSRGSFFGKLESLPCPRTALFAGSYNQTIRINWRSPDNGYVFGLFRSPRAEGHLNGRTFSDGTIALWDLESEVDGMLPPGLAWFGYKVPANLLERVTEAEGLPLAGLLPKKGPMHESDPELVANLAQKARAILDAGGVKNASPFGSLSEDDEEDLIAAFLSCFKGSVDHQPPDRWRNRFRVARRADEYLRVHLNRYVAVGELCRELSVSRRLLHYAMMDVYQTPPVTYHRRLRLQCVRTDIMDPREQLSVCEAAEKWGFHNPGDFSRYYREMFSELPSASAQSR
jgi:AraC family ethanolamine operon transcriptional activator